MQTEIDRKTKIVKLPVETASVDLVMSKEREKELERILKEYKKGVQELK
jgi:hypothetical protein